MIAFVILNKNSLSFMIATNLKSISQFSGVKYTLLYNRLRNSDYFEDD